MINLMQGDCLELMKDISDKSIDMILCDLPYGTTDCKWDTRIPFEPLWEQYKRIITDNGAICLFGSEPFSTLLRYSNLKMYKYDWIWLKNNCTGFIHCKNKPLKNYEIISVFSMGSVAHANLSEKRMIYNPQNLIECNVVHHSGKKFGGMYHKSPSNKDTCVQEFKNYPKMVLEFKNCDKKFHNTQKPVPLLEYLIKTYTNEGMTVLDNCMGSGSAGVACVNTNRNFIGMELDENYFEIAKSRIEETIKSKETGVLQ